MRLPVYVVLSTHTAIPDHFRYGVDSSEPSSYVLVYTLKRCSSYRLVTLSPHLTVFSIPPVALNMCGVGLHMYARGCLGDPQAWPCVFAPDYMFWLLTPYVHPMLFRCVYSK